MPKDNILVTGAAGFIGSHAAEALIDAGYNVIGADNFCDFELGSHPVPTKSNPLGAKGCGEAGTSGGLPSVANAVIDALSELGIKHLEMPMTPARVWQAIEDAKR